MHTVFGSNYSSRQGLANLEVVGNLEAIQFEVEKRLIIQNISESMKG